MKKPIPVYFTETNELPRFPQAPARPTFGFLLGGTTLGIFFGCVLLCAGAGPASVILILLSTLGAFTGGILESFWPKHSSRRGSFRRTARSASTARHECHRCGEVFEPSITCPMCGQIETNPR